MAKKAQKLLFTVIALIAGAYFAYANQAATIPAGSATSSSTSSVSQEKLSPIAFDKKIVFNQLPVQGQQTYRLILQGGPFPYEKDGTVFGNRERLLPKQKRGYYREYTVRTPKVRHRGARRIVCGGWVKHEPQACYYTADHYDSFQFIQAPSAGSGASIVN